MAGISKTPDEIKKGMEWCANDASQCSDNCPYFNSLSNGVDCAQNLHSDALALIQQLESHNAELLEKVKQLERERDKLVIIADNAGVLCDECKNLIQEDDCQACEEVDYFCHLCTVNCACNKCIHGSRYEWRGLCKEDGGKDAKDS